MGPFPAKIRLGLLPDGDVLVDGVNRRYLAFLPDGNTSYQDREPGTILSAPCRFDNGILAPEDRSGKLRCQICQIGLHSNKPVQIDAFDFLGRIPEHLAKGPVGPDHPAVETLDGNACRGLFEKGFVEDLSLEVTVIPIHL